MHEAAVDDCGVHRDSPRDEPRGDERHVLKISSFGFLRTPGTLGDLRGLLFEA